MRVGVYTQVCLPEKEGNAQRRPKRTPDGTPQALHDQAPFQPGPYEDQVGVDMDFFANGAWLVFL